MNKKIFNFLNAIYTGSFSASLLLIIKYSLGEKVSISEEIYMLITIWILLIIIFYYLINFYGWRLFKHIYRDKIKNEINKSIEEEINILQKKYFLTDIYENMNTCIDEICEKLKSEKKVSIYLQLGTQILSPKGKLYQCLRQNENIENVKILHSSPRTPYLSSKKAEKREKGKFNEWKVQLQSAENFAKELSYIFNDGIIKSRIHHEGFYFRLFLFENECYVQPYIYKSNNSQKAPVFKIIKDENSIYNMFVNFFNNKWLEYKPNTYYVNDFIKESFPVAVTAILKFKSLYIFTVPKRYIKKDEKKVFIHAIGGKTSKNETYKSALTREVKEEINSDIIVHSSKFTTYMNTIGKQLSEPFKDTPSPLIIYRRDNKYSRDTRVKWILIYNCELVDNSIEHLKPQNEIEFIFLLSENLLKKINNTKEVVRIIDILRDTEGSKIVGDINKINKYCTVIPEGIVPIIANYIK